VRRAAHGKVTATGLASPDLMSNPSPAASLRQQQVRLDLVAVAAAISLLDHVPGPARPATMPQALRSVMPRLAAM
jgi:hypothetical protein